MNNSESWSDADYARAMGHLDTLQQQINDLRLALTSTISPLATLTSPNTAWTPPPSHVYSTFANNAIKTVEQVGRIREDCTNDYSRRVMERVQESVKRQGDVQTQPWSTSVREPVNGLKMEGVNGHSDIVSIKQEPDIEPETSDEDVADVVSSFTQSFPPETIQVERQSAGLIKLAVRLQNRDEWLIFTIRKTSFKDKHDWYYRAACATGSVQAVRQAITRCLEARPHRRDLRLTMYMLTAYHNLNSAECVKCHKMVAGPEKLLPTERRRDNVSNMSDLKTDWQTYHEHCLL